MTDRNIYAPRYKIADAFCGCGGLSLGFALTQRFDTVLGLDINPEALETFRFNHARYGYEPSILEQDIRDTDHEAFDNTLKNHGITSPGELDCLIGGPPCEGFSQNRTDQTNGFRTHKFIEDPRNHLFRWFVALAEALKPKVILIENVPDLVRHRDGETRNEILMALDDAGYTAAVRVVNAAEYGVPQMRRRAFFLAQRKDDLLATGVKLTFPVATHVPYPMMHENLIDEPEWLPGDSGYWVTVREAIGDLPAATESDDYDHTQTQYPSAKMTTFRSLMRSTKEVPYNHLARKLGKGGLIRLLALRPGQTCAELPDDLRPKGFYHYSYTRLVWSEPARTITKFAYHVGSGQFGHPVENRAITMREAARLQSFPDDFRFVGTTEIRKISAMVGSAVPPLLGRAVARQVAQYLDALHLHRMSPEERAQARVVEGDAVMRRLESQEWSIQSEQEQRVLF